LDIGNLANSFFLLRIPRVKEILGKTVSNFTPSEIDPNTLAFKDKNQEAQFMIRKENSDKKSK